MHITSLSLQELREEAQRIGWEPYRADQILNWIYKRFITDFDRMTNLPKEHRNFLKQNYLVHSLELLECAEGGDSTKFLFQTKDGHIVETVLIYEKDHLTLCVSSQIGCAVGCSFCATTRDGLIRNLRGEEIIDQFLQVQKLTQERIRNVVFMGMGEPLANYQNVRKAVEIMVSSWGFDLSKRRVSISTSGLINQLKDMAKDPLMRELNLAVSINAPFQALRERLMPISKTNQLEDLLEVLYQFPYPPDRRIMIEYVLISGVNDGKSHARELAKLLKKGRKKFKVNLIPFNPDPQLPYKRPVMESVYEFQKILWEEGISTFIRISKGMELFGACGQLRSKRFVLI